LEETAEPEGTEDQAEPEALGVESRRTGLMGMVGMPELGVVAAMAERAATVTTACSEPEKTAAREALAERLATAEPEVWAELAEERRGLPGWMASEAMEARVASEEPEGTARPEGTERMEFLREQPEKMARTEEMEP
jgi:hypothetical protein